MVRCDLQIVVGDALRFLHAKRTKGESGACTQRRIKIDCREASNDVRHKLFSVEFVHFILLYANGQSRKQQGSCSSKPADPLSWPRIPIRQGSSPSARALPSRYAPNPRGIPLSDGYPNGCGLLP